MNRLVNYHFMSYRLEMVCAFKRANLVELLSQPTGSYCMLFFSSRGLTKRIEKCRMNDVP